MGVNEFKVQSFSFSSVSGAPVSETTSQPLIGELIAVRYSTANNATINAGSLFINSSGAFGTSTNVSTLAYLSLAGSPIGAEVFYPKVPSVLNISGTTLYSPTSGLGVMSNIMLFNHVTVTVSGLGTSPETIDLQVDLLYR